MYYVLMLQFVSKRWPNCGDVGLLRRLHYMELLRQLFVARPSCNPKLTATLMMITSRRSSCSPKPRNPRSTRRRRCPTPTLSASDPTDVTIIVMMVQCGCQLTGLSSHSGFLTPDLRPAWNFRLYSPVCRSSQCLHRSDRSLRLCHCHDRLQAPQALRLIRHNLDLACQCDPDQQVPCLGNQRGRSLELRRYDRGLQLRRRPVADGCRDLTRPSCVGLSPKLPGSAIARSHPPPFLFSLAAETPYSHIR